MLTTRLAGSGARDKPKPRTILIRGARQLLTMHGPQAARRGTESGDLSLIEDGSVLISDGVITNVGSTRRIENLAAARSAEEVNAAGQVVMPGFVDAHAHIPELTGQMTTRVLEHRVGRVMDLWVRHGTTAVEAKCSGEPRILQVMHKLDGKWMCLRLTWMAGWGAGIAAAYSELQLEYVNSLRTSVLPRLRARGLTNVVEACCDPRGFHLEAAKALVSAAKELGFSVKLYGDQAGRSGAAQLAAESHAVSCAGLNYSNASDILALSRARIPAVLLPGLVHQGQADKLAPAREMIGGGVAVALGTGFQMPHGGAFSMQTVIGLACRQMKMSAAEAVTAATINSAYAAGIGDRCGSLEFGKDADIILLKVPDYRDISAYFGANLVGLVMRKGEVAYREGAVTQQ